MLDKTEYQALRDFGRRLRELRKANGITQTELARVLGFSHPSSISMIENGRCRVSEHAVARIMQELDSETNAILDGMNTKR